MDKNFRVIGIKTGRPHAGGNETLCLGLMNDEIQLFSRPCPRPLRSLLFHSFPLKRFRNRNYMYYGNTLYLSLNTYDSSINAELLHKNNSFRFVISFLGNCMNQFFK